MPKQERTYTLSEVHTTVGTMGEVRFDQTFMEVLGVKPGERLSFFIDAEGSVTVKGLKNEPAVPPPSAMSGTLQQGDVTQATLFGAEVPVPTVPKRRGKQR